MKFVRNKSIGIVLFAGLLLCQRDSVAAQVQQTDDLSYVDSDESAVAANEPADVQIARAMAAGPPHVADFARIIGVDAQGKRIVLREGRLHVPTRQPRSPWPSRIMLERGGATVEVGFSCAQSQAEQHRARHHLHACGLEAAQRIQSV
jgi:hypothetical protein